MLLKRIEKDNVVQALYESSNIKASKYDKNSKRLVLIFKGATEYIYEDVSITDYHKLELADSQGAAFNKYLRHYKFVKGGAVDMEELNARIEEVKQEEIDGLTQNVAQLCKIISDNYAESNTIGDSNLKDLVRMINFRAEKMKK